MTASFTDPGTAFLHGRICYMLLGPEEGPATTVVCLWQAHYSPVGSGRALFVRSELTGGATRIYADHLELADYLRAELFAKNPEPFGLFADPAVAVAPARFRERGDPRSTATIEVSSATDRLAMRWSAFLPAFVRATGPDPRIGQQDGRYAMYVYARRARFALDGAVAAGVPLVRRRDGRDYLSAGFALGVTWVRPAE